MMTIERPFFTPPIPAAAMFDAPGRPRPLARRLAIHNRVVRKIREFFLDEGFHEMPVTALADHPARVQLNGMLALGFDAVWCESEIMPSGGHREPRHLRGFKLMEAARADLDLRALGALQQSLLKFVAGDLCADLLGGRHVTRLDRMLHADHAVLTYDEACGVLAAKGWNLTYGCDLHVQARATLSRHCGNLPCLITHVPRTHRLTGTAAMPACSVPENIEYILPYAGVTMEGEVLDGHASFSLDLGRLLQYLMGLENITDTLIDPMDRIAKVMGAVPRGLGLKAGAERA